VQQIGKATLTIKTVKRTALIKNFVWPLRNG